jgi:hypothetical protein
MMNLGTSGKIHGDNIGSPFFGKGTPFSAKNRGDGNLPRGSPPGILLRLF